MSPTRPSSKGRSNTYLRWPPPGAAVAALAAPVPAAATLLLSPRFRFRRRAAAVFWLLIVAIGLQGLAAGVLGTLGPRHVHRSGNEPTEAGVLVDFRRGPGDITARPAPTHVATAFGHFHAEGRPLRHHHAAGDASVVSLDGPMADNLADEAGLHAVAAVFVALLPSGTSWHPERTRESFAAKALWPLLTHVSQPPRRPPRTTA